MRENTRCEVDEPISTPTLRTTISSSSTSDAPGAGEENAAARRVVGHFSMPAIVVARRPAPVSRTLIRVNSTDDRITAFAVMTPGTRRNLRPRTSARRPLLVEFGSIRLCTPSALSFASYSRADERVLHPVRDGGAALGDVHRGVVGVLLAGRARLAAGIVRAEPGGQPQRVLRGAEMLVDTSARRPAPPSPCRPARSRRA